MLMQKFNWIVILLTICQISNILAQTVTIKCYKCDSSADNCIKNVTAVETVDSTTDLGCVTQIDSTGKVIRDKATEGQTDGPNLKICKTNECNNYNICKTCDSSKDKNCAQTDSRDATNEICPTADTKCLTIIKEKITFRRCATADDLKACEAPLCASCSGGNCNTEIFPTNRLRCYKCAIDDSTCMNVVENSDKHKSLPCELYDKNDTCYAFGTVASMARGCVSDSTTENKCPTPESNEHCSTCATDNCNGQMYSNAQKLQCITCNSNTTENCQWAQSANTAKDCTNPILYYQKEQCYTQVKDNVVYRGCFYDRDATLLGAECGTNNSCETCATENGCNNKDEANFTCIRCRSDNYPACRKGGDKMVGEKCVRPVPSGNGKCYYGKWNNVAIRGCTVDLDEQNLALCTDGSSKQCTICDKKDCNIIEISGAATITISTVLLSIAALVATWK